MTDALASYLHDHLAGSHFAVNLLDSLHDQYRDEELGAFALSLNTEVKQDQQTLQEIINRVGKAQLDLTEAAGWFAEKASQIKLKRDKSGGGLGTFEALEALALGIRGKWELWQALPVMREYDARIPDFDFEKLATRADDQFLQAEEQRLRFAPTLFGKAPRERSGSSPSRKYPSRISRTADFRDEEAG